MLGVVFTQMLRRRGLKLKPVCDETGETKIKCKATLLARREPNKVHPFFPSCDVVRVQPTLPSILRQINKKQPFDVQQLLVLVCH
jgi:hypothetical protein